MGLAEALTKVVLPGEEPKGTIYVERLENILRAERGASQITAVVRVYRHDGSGNRMVSPNPSRLYDPDHRKTAAYDSYYFDVLIENRVYRLQHPLLQAALHPEYAPDGQTIIDLELKPENPELVSFYLDSQAIAAVLRIRELFGSDPAVFISREGKLKFCYPFDIAQAGPRIKSMETRFRYKPSHRVTKLAFPGASWPPRPTEQELN